MAINDLSFNQVATLLNAITSQATGQTELTPTNTNEFVSLATTALKTGYDPLATAISQVLSWTIFSERPYTAKFKGLKVSNQQYGNIVRKLNIADKPAKEDARFNLVDGAVVAPSMFSVNKPEILQTNFYGANVFSRDYTLYKDQLDCAFRSPDEFQRFISMVVRNTQDKIEQDRENLARATLANFIGGIAAENKADRVVHLLTEYNAATGKVLTNVTVYEPENFPAFMAWVYARIGEISELMTERSQKFQTIVNNKNINRHTPAAFQRLYLSTAKMLQYDSMVLANAFHDNYLKYADFERVNFWQSIDDRQTINVKASYLGADGLIKTQEKAAKVENIFGIIFDDEALGFTEVNEWSQPSPFEASGGYTTFWYHFTLRFWNDYTEKAVLLLLD